MTKHRILIVEDDAIAGFIMRKLFQNHEFEVIDVVPRGEDAVPKIKESKPDLITMDISLAGKMDGVEVTKEIQPDIDAPVIYCTAYSDEYTKKRVNETQYAGFMTKPIDHDQLLKLVNQILSSNGNTSH